MLLAPIVFLLIALVSGGLCLADLPVPAASAVRSLAASCLAFSLILAIASRGLLGRDADNPEGG
jgi:hypothetical protein